MLADKVRRPTRVVAAAPSALQPERRAHRARETRRSRTGPRARDGSTGAPRCVISISPPATMRRAAARAGSIKARQSSPSPATWPAASDGQIEASAARAPRSARIASSRAASTSRTRRPRHASLQYRIDAQSRAHFLRHVMRRPHDAHGLAAGSVRAVLMMLVE